MNDCIRGESTPTKPTHEQQSANSEKEEEKDGLMLSRELSTAFHTKFHASLLRGGA